MKIKSILLTFLIFISSYSFCQEMIAQFKGGNGKWGYVNTKGEIVVEPKYKRCYPFRNGLAKVDGNKFINSKGEELKVQYKLIDTREFKEGLVAVNIKEKWGYMNTEGELEIPAIYQKVTDFNNGFAVVSKENEFYIIDINGNKTEVKTTEELIKIKKFYEGLAIIVINKINGDKANSGIRFGFINENAKVIIEPKYLKVGNFHGGMAWFRTIDRKIGFINKKGEEVIEPQFRVAGNFDPISGLARIEYVENEKKVKGYVNMKGEIKHFENSTIFKHFTEGLCVEKKDDLVGFIDATGNWVIEPKYKVATPFLNGFSKAKMMVNRKPKWGIINKKGEWVIEPNYINIYEFYPVD